MNLSPTASPCCASALLIPVFILVFYLPNTSGPTPRRRYVFALGSITDWLDGYLARKLDQTSASGRFLIRSPTS